MQINVSYLKGDKVLKDNMWLTAKPLYRNIDIDWEDMHKLVTSDYIQYSPYYYQNRIKKGENWNNDNQNLLIFDIDDGMSMVEATKLFRRYKHLITTTKSHRMSKNGIKCDRYRVILPASNIPTDDKIYFEMLRAMEGQVPAIDPQPNCKSGAFLGNSEAENYYNDGEIYDCTKAVELAKYKMINKEKLKESLRDNRVQYTYEHGVNVKTVKEGLTVEIIKDIIQGLGYELEGNKFRLREERTPSCTIFNDCKMKDFGGEFEGDIFSLLCRYHNMKFPEAVNYVNEYIRSLNE